MANQQDIIDRARKVLPGGSFGNFDAGTILREGKGSRVWDEDGNEYVDYLIGSGPMLLGHGHPEVLDAVRQQLDKGMTFFANNAHGIELAEEICKASACAEQVRFQSTGGEVDMYAIRLARAVTGRDTIIKFEGGYHGMSAEAQMSLSPEKLVNFPNAVPDSAGIPASVQDNVLVAPYNDIGFVRSLIAEHKDEIAAVLVEPLQRIIPQQPGFLAALREETEKNNILMIFDEVVTGFRLEYGGAQARYGVTPDIATYGKVIGGGFPLAAIAGKADIMAHFDKAKVGAENFLMQIGTLSGNPIAAVAGLKTLEILRRPGQYEKLQENGNILMDAIREHLGKTGHAFQITGDPVMFDVVFTDRPIRNYRDVKTGDVKKAAAFNAALHEKGILKSPSKFYISLSLSEADLAQTVDAIAYAAQQV